MQIDCSLFQLYLFKYHSVPLGKIGTIIMENIPAFHDYTSRTIHPSMEVFKFTPTINNDLEEKFQVFAEQKGYGSPALAEVYETIKTQLKQNSKVNLTGLGTLLIENSIYRFDPEVISDKFLVPVTAGAVIHEGEVHEVKVGEQVHTSEEMKEMLSGKKSKDYWWVYALILVVVAVAAILYYVYGDKL